MADRIDDIVGEAAFRQIKKLQGDLEKLNAEFIDTLYSVEALNNELSKTGSWREYKKSITDADNALTKLRLNQIKIQQEEQRLANLRQQNALREEAASARRMRSQERLNAVNAKTNSAFAQLTKALKDAERAAADAGATFGVNSNEFLLAAKNVSVLRKQVDGIEQPLKLFGRNVGNYASQAFGYVRQAAAILPGLGIQGIFLLFYEGLTAIYEQFTKTGNAISKFAAINKSLTEVVSNGNKSAGEQITTVKLLALAAQDGALSDRERLKAATELQKIAPTTFGNLKVETILHGNLSTAIKDETASIIANSLAVAAKAKLDDIEAKKLDNAFQRQKVKNANRAELSRLPTSTGGESDLEKSIYVGALAGAKGASNFRATTALKQLDDSDKVLDAQANFISKYVKVKILEKAAIAGIGKDGASGAVDTGILDAQIKLAQQQADNSKRLSENEGIDYIKRNDALREYYEKSQLIINLNGQKEIKQAKDNAQEIELIKQTTVANQLGLDAEFLKLQLDLGKKALSDQDQARLNAQQKVINAITADEQLRLDILNKTFADGIISEKQYGELRLKIEKDYAVRLIEQEIKNASDLLAITTISDDDRAKLEKQLADLKLKLSQAVADKQKADTNDVVDNDKDAAEKRKKLEEEVAAKKLELAKAVFDFEVQLGEAQFDRQKNAVSEEIDQLSIRSEREIDTVNKSTLSEQDKANKIAVIQASSAAQKEALERKQRAIDQQRARFEKAASIARIIQETAVQVAKYGFFTPLGLLAAAIGATEVATVLATPIPKFEKGGRKQGTGLAMYGEAGTELIIDPSGRMSLTPSTPTIGTVKHGTEIISNKDLIRMITTQSFGDILQYGSKVDMSPVVNATDRNTKEIKKAIERTGTPRKSGISRNGWSTYLRRNI